jgi:SAM-dependent methyltransferase
MDNLRNQTNSSFRQKWTNGSTAFLNTTMDEGSEIFTWITNRNGFHSSSDVTEWLLPRKRVLDAGCGNGRVTHLLRRYMRPDAELLGIDFSSHEIATNNFGDLPNTDFQFADLMQNLSHLGTFDLIYCQEVLHHTQDPQKAFRNLTEILTPKGEIAIYVYKKKAEIREFSDDFIRDRIKDLSYEETKEVIGQITNFARVVAQIPGEFSFPGIAVLGINESHLSLHRFIYNNLFKNFWNEELSYDENFLINFDWYHPSLCSRHTLSEILEWYADSGLTVIHALEDDFGITVRGVASNHLR